VNDLPPAEEQFFEDLMGFVFLVLCDEAALNEARAINFWFEQQPANEVHKPEDLPS